MKTRSIFILSVALFAALLLTCGCSKKVRVEIKQIKAKPEVEVTGYGWGDMGEEQAIKAARLEATSLAIPRSMEFTFLQVPPYSLFKTEKVEYTNVEIAETEQLPDVEGTWVAKATARRSNATLQAMRHMRVISFNLTCKAETFEERVAECNSRLYETAMIESAKKHFGKFPEKMRGNFTFFYINREDNGKDSLKLETAVFVGFLGAGEITREERSTVLTNAWNNAVKNGQGAQAAPIYRMAFEAYPNSAFAKEFALFEMSENRLDNAILALNDAIKLNPHDLELVKILYQLYKKQGDTAMMDKIEDKLVELEAWEENPGADITNTFKYRYKVKWTEEGESEPSGMIHFREIDETEMEEMKEQK